MYRFLGIYAVGCGVGRANYLQATVFFTMSALMFPFLSTTTCRIWRSSMSGVGPWATNLDFKVVVVFEATSRVLSLLLVLSRATYWAPVVCPIPVKRLVELML